MEAHQLRSVRQDQARIDCLNLLDDASVLVTQDWAMKFLPTKYRESQSNWFGKRGLSWHLSVVVQNVDIRTYHRELFARYICSCMHLRAYFTHP